MRKFAAVVFVFIFLTALPAQARDKLLDIQTLITEKGIKVWLVEDHSIPLMALKFAFKGAGAVNDPADKQGLAQLASNTMDEGAGELDSQSFQKELRDLVIELRFDSSRDHFGGRLKTLTKNRGRAFELLHLAVTNPRFDEEPVGRMREANLSRIRSALSDPDWKAARLLNDRAFAGHPYAQNSGGTLSSLEKITPEDLHAFTKTLSRDNLVVAAAGDIDAATLSSAVDMIFGDLPEESSKTDIAALTQQNQGKVFIYKQDVPQTVIEMIQPGIDIHDPDYHTAQVMNFILGSSGFGSRLTKTVREERGLTYGIYSYFYDLDYYDGLAVSTSTKTGNEKEIIELVKSEWNKMRGEPVTQEELDDAKAYLIGSLPLSLTSTDQIASLLLTLLVENMPADYLDTREKNIRAATSENIQKVAQRVLDPDAFTTILVGNVEEIENAEKVEDLPNVE